MQSYARHFLLLSRGVLMLTVLTMVEYCGFGIIRAYLEQSQEMSFVE
jgi:hypothetical protein